MRQVQEKTFEQYRELCSVFIDFRKAFDTVDRELLCKVLRAFGCPTHLVDMIRPFHEGAEGEVTVAGRESEKLIVLLSTKQGCVLAPTLFAVLLLLVLLEMSKDIKNLFTSPQGQTENS